MKHRGSYSWERRENGRHTNEIKARQLFDQYAVYFVKIPRVKVAKTQMRWRPFCVWLPVAVVMSTIGVWQGWHSQSVSVWHKWHSLSVSACGTSGTARVSAYVAQVAQPECQRVAQVAQPECQRMWHKWHSQSISVWHKWHSQSVSVWHKWHSQSVSVWHKWHSQSVSVCGTTPQPREACRRKCLVFSVFRPTSGFVCGSLSLNAIYDGSGGRGGGI